MFDFTLSQDECEKIQKFKAETLNNFSKAYEDARNSKIEDTPSRKDNDIAIVEGTIETSLWNQAIAKWHSEGWAVDGFTENMYGLRADSNDNPGVIDIGFYDGHYYIQTTYLDDSDFAKSMKRKYKVGRRSYGSWWTFLSEPYYNIEEEQLLKTFNGNQAFQKYIVDYVDSLIADLKKYDRTAKWKKNLTANEDWSIYVMYLDLLVCDFTYEEEGNPYLDIKENEATGKVYIHMSNRRYDVSLIKKTLKRIGCGESCLRKDYALLEEIDLDQVEVCANKWIDAISKV